MLTVVFLPDGISFLHTQAMLLFIRSTILHSRNYVAYKVLEARFFPLLLNLLCNKIFADENFPPSKDYRAMKCGHFNWLIF